MSEPLNVEEVNAALVAECERLGNLVDSLRERPTVDPLREALEQVIDFFDHTDDGTRFRHRWGREPSLMDVVENARAALASPAAPRPEGLDVEPGHNHTTNGLPTFPVCRAACPLGCDQPLPPTEQVEVSPGRFLPRPRMFVVDPIAEGEAAIAVRLASPAPRPEGPREAARIRDEAFQIGQDVGRAAAAPRPEGLLQQIADDAAWLHDNVPDLSPDGVASLRDICREIAKAAAAPRPEGPCARYWGSDGTLCSTHHGRFADNAATKCARLSDTGDTP